MAISGYESAPLNMASARIFGSNTPIHSIISTDVPSRAKAMGRPMIIIRANPPRKMNSTIASVGRGR